jgi:TonB family protein
MKREARLSLGQGQLMLWILAGSVLAVAAMLAFFKVTGVRHVPVPQQGPRIEWMPARPAQPSPNDERYVIADVLDPSLMSLPSPHGFSKEVWERKGEAAQRSLGWNEQPAYLSVTLPEAPSSWLEPVPLDSAVLSAAEKAPAEPEEPDDELIQSAVPANQSAVHMLGPLENRGVVRLPELPVITNSVPLRPSQVRIGVGAGGLVHYASLDRSCGSESVDAQAVALAQQLRFEAEQNGVPNALTWGVVRFLWATQAPATTNSESDATPPQ